MQLILQCKSVLTGLRSRRFFISPSWTRSGRWRAGQTPAFRIQSPAKCCWDFMFDCRFS